MVRKLLIQDDLLSELMFGLLTAALLGIPVQYLAPDWTGILAGCLAVGLLVFWQIRLKIRKIWLFLLISVGLLALPVFLPLPIWPRVILVASLLTLAIRTFVMRVRESGSQPAISLGGSAVALAYLLALNLLAVKLQLTLLSESYFYFGIAYLLLTIWRWHQISLAERLIRFETMPTQPVAQIRRFNQFLLGGFAGLLLIILLASPWLHLQDLIPMLGQLLLLGIRWLLRMLSSQGGDTPVETTTAATTSGGSDTGLPEAGETPYWLQMLQEIMMYVMSIAVVVLLVAIIVYGIYTLFKRFNSGPPKNSDVLESLLPKLSDQIKTRLNHNYNRLALQFGQNPEQRIRRLYYRLIDWQAHHGLKIDPAMTPKQISAQLLQDRALDTHELTELYELARYGSDQCTADDVRRMHELCQNCRRSI